MSSVIGGMEEDIARTMAQIGWPGADQVQPEEDNADENQAQIDDEPGQQGVQDAADQGDQVDGDPATADHVDDAQGDGAGADPDSAQVDVDKTYRPKWKKSALAVLDELAATNPEKAAQIIEEDKRREENFHKGIEQYRSGHQESKEWSDVVAPYRATIDRFQVKPQEAVRTLLATDHTLRYGQRHEKVGLMFQVMQNYGIDPADIVGVFQNVNQQQGEPLDPRIAQMQQKLAGFEQQQYNQQREAQEREQRAAAEQQRAANEMIERFAQDPDHEHFELLKPLMGGYLQQGAAKDMDEAYEMALRAHPQTANIWIAQQQKQWAESRKAVAEKAKKVTNVRSNGRASASGPTVAATMDETIAREAKRLGLA